MATNTRPTTNREGLTLAEFLNAVGPLRPWCDASKLETAWARGEDPADHRAAYEVQRREDRECGL